jgi:hypothetical protein
MALTKANLDRVEVASSNRDLWLARDENFERVPLGLPTRRVDGATMVREWEKVCKEASAVTVRGRN